LASGAGEAHTMAASERTETAPHIALNTAERNPIGKRGVTNETTAIFDAPSWAAMILFG
jgi:hypothetical protein